MCEVSNLKQIFHPGGLRQNMKVAPSQLKLVIADPSSLWWVEIRLGIWLQESPSTCTTPNIDLEYLRVVVVDLHDAADGQLLLDEFREDSPRFSSSPHVAD